jgi:NADH-quinone oxidoreductase subunit A
MSGVEPASSIYSEIPYWPFIIYVMGVFLTVGVMLGLSYILGQRHESRATNEPYESGILITGSSRIRFDARFYLIAMTFVIFDLESVFLYAWSLVAVRLGKLGYYPVLFFSAMLIAALAYVWRSGGFDFGPRLRQPNNMKGTESQHAAPDR